jgi:8-oxo-dGTP pyrophosphatase MutT (NUDIX family)
MQDKLRELLLQRNRRVVKDETLKPSAVLLPLFIKNGEYHLIFIKRGQGVEDHKGEISFPGGLYEKGDEGLEKTALREAFEEIRIHPQDVKILGMLDDTKTISTHYRVTPIVGIIPHPYSFTINTVEVDEIIDISINHLLDEGNSGEESITRGGITYTGDVYHYKHYLIWGATARILKNLLNLWTNLKDPPCTHSSQS